MSKIQEICMKQEQSQAQILSESLVVFKFKRLANTESLNQIPIVSRKVVKLDPLSSLTIKTNKTNSMSNQKGELNKQFMINNLMAKLDLTENEKIQKNFPQNQQIQQGKKQYFLQKVSQQLKNTLTYLDLAKQNRKNYQKQARQEKFNKNRLTQTKNSIQKQKRVHYKVIDIKKENFVNFNGKMFQYENLQNQQSQIQQFYVLRKGKIEKQVYHNGLSVCLPEQVQYLIEEENIYQGQQQEIQDESDSNKEDRSDYDYPEEDYHSENSDKSSQDLIQRKGFDSEENIYENEYQEDQYELYQRYQKRCQRKQKGDQELLYMYGLKSNKYDSQEQDY